MAHRNKGRKYFKCPDCGKKGVYLALGAEDWWACRYCTDYSCCQNGVTDGDRIDVELFRRLIAANPDSEEELKEWT